MNFEETVLDRVSSYIDRRCPEIDSELTSKFGYGSTINPHVKSYCSTLSKRMLGYTTCQEFNIESHGYAMKNITLKPNGEPKEHMSFRKFNGNEMMVQEWDQSAQYREFSQRSLMMVYLYTSKPVTYNQNNIVFKGAFFWTIDDSTMSEIKEVWEDTKRKIIDNKMDQFIRAKDNRVAFIKPHGANGRDVYVCNGETVQKESFWLKSSYIDGIVKKNLPIENDNLLTNGNQLR